MIYVVLMFFRFAESKGYSSTLLNLMTFSIWFFVELRSVGLPLCIELN